MLNIFKLNLLIWFLILLISNSPVQSKEGVKIVADQISYLENGSILKATGNVQVKYNKYFLTTPELIFNRETNTLTAADPIQLKSNDNLKILAGSTEISNDFKNIIAKHATVLIDKQFYLQSEKMERVENGHSIFYSSIGSACVVCPSSPIPMWQIKADTIYHDRSMQKLHFKNAWIEVVGVPVFFTPYLRIPEPGIKRATGLLTPKVLTSNLLGVGIKQPYYINLNPSSDITVSVLKTTKTKILLETEYRKLFETGALKISSAAKPNNSTNILDGYFQIVGNINILNDSKLSFDSTAVSDSGFLGKYGYSDTDRLTSYISLTKQDGNNFSEVSTTYFTSLRDNYQEEYIVVPNFYTRYFNNHTQLDLSTSTEISVVGLTKTKSENNLRLNISFDAEKKFETQNGIQFKGTTKFSTNVYRIKSINEKTRFAKRLDPTLALELNLPFFRKKPKQLDVIKPKLQLVYNPSLKSNDEITSIDSQQIKLDQTSLFSLNRFSGLDKQESGLRLNSGIEYSVENNDYFSYNFALGQIFRKDPSTQFSEGSGISGIKSDILISGNFEYDSFLQMHAQQLYDLKLKLKQGETTLSYQNHNNTISSGLIFLESDISENRPNDLTELIVGIKSKVNSNWTTSIDLRRHLNQNENINASVEFSYKNECSKINLVFSRRFTETNSLPADTKIELTFDLNGVGDKRRLLQKSNCALYN